LDKYITIVSGLPRSGTSMMMMMLEAGGMEVVVDNIRKPDEDNPKGYYEFETVKKIKENVSWLDGTFGKAFKMVYLLLYDLPPDKNYKIIFMKRKMKEIIASQRKMLERKGLSSDTADDEKMGKLFENQLAEIQGWLAVQKNIAVLYIDYNNFIDTPLENAKAVNRFLDDKLDIQKMAEVVDKSLYRQRK